MNNSYDQIESVRTFQVIRSKMRKKYTVIDFLIIVFTIIIMDYCQLDNEQMNEEYLQIALQLLLTITIGLILPKLGRINSIFILFLINLLTYIIYLKKYSFDQTKLDILFNINQITRNLLFVMLSDMSLNNWYKELPYFIQLLIKVYIFFKLIHIILPDKYILLYLITILILNLILIIFRITCCEQLNYNICNFCQIDLKSYCQIILFMFLMQSIYINYQISLQRLSEPISNYLIISQIIIAILVGISNNGNSSIIYLIFILVLILEYINIEGTFYINILLLQYLIFKSIIYFYAHALDDLFIQCFYAVSLLSIFMMRQYINNDLHVFMSISSIPVTMAYWLIECSIIQNRYDSQNQVTINEDSTF